MSTEKILDKGSFLKGVEIGRALRRWSGYAPAPQPETGPFQMKVNMQNYGIVRFAADMRGTFVIDWGDGVSESVANTGTAGIQHDYPSLGEYTITIEGDLLYLGHGPWTRNGLKAVTELLSPLPASLSNIYYAFSECSGLTSVPADLFSRCGGLKTLTGCFYQSPITDIPPGLFAGAPNVTSFESCFASCTALHEIPAGLFDGCSKATNFESCFMGCSAITGIPAGLFDDCAEALTFASCFKNCSKLVDAPSGLFQNQRNATRFTSCFGSCSALASVPENLFAGCAAATQFDGCFQMCKALMGVDSGLFASSPLAETFRACFSNCVKLTDAPEDLFDNNPAITQLNECFLRCLKLSHAPALWVSFPNASHTKCFSSCSIADNYDEIPSGWK